MADMNQLIFVTFSSILKLFGTIIYLSIWSIYKSRSERKWKNEAIFQGPDISSPSGFIPYIYDINWDMI